MGGASLAGMDHSIGASTHFAYLAGKKIVILIGAFVRGGCERQAYLLARELRQKHGLDAEVWSLFHAHWYSGNYAEEFEAAGVPTRVLGFGHPRFGWVQRCLPIIRELRRAGVAVLLPFTTWPNVVAGLTYRLAGVKLCVWGERHAGGDHVPGVERLALRQYGRFVANSTAGVEFLAGEMRVPRERISLVPNGVEAPKIDSTTDWRAELGLGPSQPLVVKVANVTGFKDHATLLRAWKIVQDAWQGGDKPVLALAGYHADVYEQCQRVVRDAGMNSTVRFLGGICDVPTLLHACDLTAFSSRNEGMPNAVLECMAAGKAIVASDLPGIRDVLGPNSAGVLVPPGDPERFAATLLGLLRDKERRDALGAANRARVRAEFSVERMVERHLNVIQANLPKISYYRRRKTEFMTHERT
jgi:glycosyltransferase involved in cell wall biosynthesis